MAQRQWKGAAVLARLTGAISGTPATFAIDVATGFPTGALAFVVTVGRGTASEEKILVTRAGGTTLTVVTRGYDDTASVDHSAQATVEHTLAAAALNEHDDHMYDITNDDHTQYLTNARHDVEARHTFGAALGTAATPSASAPGDAAVVGTGANPAREDHVHSREALPRYRISHTFVVAGDVVVASGDLDFICPFYAGVIAGRTLKLVAARHRINSGTSATVKLQINGVDATGFTALSVTTTTGVTDPADITLGDGDLIALVVTGVAGSPKNMSFTLYLEHS